MSGNRRMSELVMTFPPGPPLGGPLGPGVASRVRHRGIPEVSVDRSAVILVPRVPVARPPLAR